MSFNFLEYHQHPGQEEEGNDSPDCIPAPTEPSLSGNEQAENVDDKRASRSLLSTSATIPGWLLEHFDVPDNCSVHRTIHKDTTLPHIQGKLLGGRFFEGKKLNGNIFYQEAFLADVQG